MDEADKTYFKTPTATGRLNNARPSLDKSKSSNIAVQSTPTSSHSTTAPPKRIINKIPLDFNKLKQAGLDRKLAEVLSKQNLSATRNVASTTTSQHISSATLHAAASTSTFVANSAAAQRTSASHSTHTQQQRERQPAAVPVALSRNEPTDLIANEQISQQVKALLKNKILNKSKQTQEQQQAKSTLATTTAYKPKTNPVSLPATTSGFSLPIAKADLSARSKPPLLLNSVNKLPRHRATCGMIDTPPKRQLTPVEVPASPLIVLENKVLAPNEKLDLSALRLPNATAAALPPPTVPAQQQIDKLKYVDRLKQVNLQAAKTNTAPRKFILNANKLQMSQEQRAQLAKEIHKKAMEVKLQNSVATTSQAETDKTIIVKPPTITVPNTTAEKVNKVARVKTINSSAAMAAPIVAVAATTDVKFAPTSAVATESTNNVRSAVDFIAQLSATNANDPNNFMNLSAEEMSMNALFASSQAAMPALVAAKTKEELPSPVKRVPKEELPTQESIKPSEELHIGMIVPIVDMNIMHATLNVNGNKPNVLCISPNSIMLESSLSAEQVEQPEFETTNSLEANETLQQVAATNAEDNLVISHKPSLVITALNEIAGNVEEVVKVHSNLNVCDKKESEPVKRVPFRAKKGKINLVQRNKKTTNILKATESTIVEKAEQLSKEADISELKTFNDKIINPKRLENNMSESVNDLKNIVKETEEVSNLEISKASDVNMTSVELISEETGRKDKESENNLETLNIKETVSNEESATKELNEQAINNAYNLKKELKTPEKNTEITAEKNDNINLNAEQMNLNNSVDLKQTERFKNELNIPKEIEKINAEQIHKNAVDLKQEERLKNNLNIPKKVEEVNAEQIQKNAVDLKQEERFKNDLNIPKEIDKQNETENKTQNSVKEIEPTLNNNYAIKSVIKTTKEITNEINKITEPINESMTLNDANKNENTLEKPSEVITIVAETETADSKQTNKVPANVAKDRDLTQLYHPPKMPKHKQMFVKPLNNNNNTNEKLENISLMDVLTQELPPAQGEPILPFKSCAYENQILYSLEQSPTAGLGIQNLLTHLAAENVLPANKAVKSEEQPKVPRKKLIKTRPVLNAKRSSRAMQAKTTTTLPQATEELNSSKEKLPAEVKTNGTHRVVTFSTSDDDETVFHGFNNEPASSKGVKKLKTTETDISDDNTPDYDETEEEPQTEATTLTKKPKAETVTNKDKSQTETARLEQAAVQANIEDTKSEEGDTPKKALSEESKPESLGTLDAVKERSNSREPEVEQYKKRKRARLTVAKEKEKNKITVEEPKQKSKKTVEEPKQKAAEQVSEKNSEFVEVLNATEDKSIIIEEPVVVKQKRSRQSRKGIKNQIVEETKSVDTLNQSTEKQTNQEQEELPQSKIVKSSEKQTNQEQEELTQRKVVKRRSKSKSATPKAQKLDKELTTSTTELQSESVQTSPEVLVVSLVAATAEAEVEQQALNGATPLNKTRKRKRQSRSSTPKPAVAEAATKDKTNTTPAAATPATVVTPTPKRRGRPPKAINPNAETPQAKKSKTDENDEATQIIEFSGPDYWPPTSGFNLRLLLIRKREQLDSEEELREDGRGKGPQQCGLCLVRCNKINWQAHLAEHYGIGWPIEQAPKYFTRSGLISMMTTFLKSGNGKRLSCRLCERQLGSGLGMMLHLEGCGAKVQRVECDKCKKSYTHLSFPQHYRSCIQRVQTANEEEVADKEGAVEAATETVFSNAGRAKRKSTLKAETKLGKMAAQLEKQSEAGKIDFEGDSSDYDMVGEKESSEEYDSEGVDSNEDAPETEAEDGEFVKCNRIRKKNVKPSASVGSAKPLYGRYKALEQVVSQRWKYFVDTNYSTNMLYTHLLPRYDVLSSDDVSLLLPSKECTSMRYAYDKLDDKAWMQLAPFEGINKKSEYICFMGQPVKELAWVPLPPTVSTQFLLCSLRNKMLGFSRRFKDKQEHALLFLLKCTLSADGDKKVWPLQTRLHYAIRVNQGPVHSFAFMPSGGYDESTNRLALLAVGSVAGAVIYGLPLQLKEETDKQSQDAVIVLQPLLRLSLDIEKPVQNPCTKICWSQGAGHSFLVSGYASGHVAFWDIADEEGLNFVKKDNESHFLPANYFYFGERSIRYLDLHYDTNGARWLAVGAMLRKLWIYDIANWSQPLPVLGDTIFNLYLGAVCWPPLWETLAVGSTALYNTQYTRMITLNPSGIIFGHSTVETLLSSPREVHFNCEQQAMVAVTDNGDVAFVFSNQFNLESVIAKRTSNCRFLCSTEACYLGDASEPSSIGPDEFKQDFGLLVKPLTNMPNGNKSTYLNPKRRPSFDLRSLLRLNSVRWNWNAAATSWVAIGAEHGLLRIINFDAGKKFEYL